MGAGKEVTIGLVGEGVYLAKEAIAKTVHGVGFPPLPELIEKVFHPFFTTKAKGRGSGLGLSMVYGFIKQSGGHIQVYSEIGHRTSIKMYLPRKSAPGEELPSSGNPTP